MRTFTISDELYEQLKRFIVDQVYAQPRPPVQAVPHTRPERIAIIGSGPCGLTTAMDLVKQGYAVTVFEALPVAGGMLRVGVPEYRLPRSVLRGELNLINKLGVNLKLNTRVGRDIDLPKLRADYQAIFIAVGTHLGRDAGIEGERLKGVLHGVKLLRAVNAGQKVEVKASAAIVG